MLGCQRTSQAPHCFVPSLPGVTETCLLDWITFYLAGKTTFLLLRNGNSQYSYFTLIVGFTFVLREPLDTNIYINMKIWVSVLHLWASQVIKQNQSNVFGSKFSLTHSPTIPSWHIQRFLSFSSCVVISWADPKTVFSALPISLLLMVCQSWHMNGIPWKQVFFKKKWGCPQYTVIYENKWDVFTLLMASNLVLARVTESENTALPD